MRFFFALWPPDDARARLARLAEQAAQEVQGKAIPPEKLHVTLAFLGEVAAERIDHARAAAERTTGDEFRLAIDRTGSFREARVAWAGCSSTPQALADLQSRLAAAQREAGFRLEERGYTPHVTLARRSARDLAPAAIETIEWTVRGYALVRSDTGRGTYTVLEEWRLGGR